MVLLASDPFLNELNKMFERSKNKGSIFLTMKRTNMKPRKSKKPNTAKEEDYMLLVRASDGKKHVSTTINASQYAKFSQSFNIIMKAHMDALKKKEKVKAKKGA